MSRNPAPLLLVTTLLAGMVVGMAVDRGVRPVALQAAPPADGNPESTSAAPAPRARATGEEAIYQELDRQYELFQHVNRTFELVSRAVSPAVVHIVARKPGRPHEEGMPAHDYEETGSGVIVRADRARTLYVLTNNHVVEGAAPEDIHVFLHDGRALRPKWFRADAKADVAVLRLTREDLPAARLGDSDEATVGSWVLALGSPFGLTHSVSTGIISARGRHEQELQEDGVENQDFLQTDAAINPGNSGGPLVNMKGEVIGINTAIASDNGGSNGVGFSIPINLARWIMNQLVTAGKVSRGAMGVDLFPEMKHEKAHELGLDRPRGAWIDKVRRPSPAAEAGLVNGDVILRYNGVEVVDLNHLINLVSMTPIGRSVEVVLWRGRQEVVKRVRIADQDALLAGASPPTLAEVTTRRPSRPVPSPAPEASNASNQALGLQLRALDGAFARQLGLSESSRGVAVVRVEPGSPMAAYFRANDVLAQVDGQSVRTVEDAVRALSRPAGRPGLEVRLQRAVNGALQWQTVRVPR